MAAVSGGDFRNTIAETEQKKPCGDLLCEILLTYAVFQPRGPSSRKTKRFHVVHARSLAMVHVSADDIIRNGNAFFLK